MNYSRFFTSTKATVNVLEDRETQVTGDRLNSDILNKYFLSVLTQERPFFSLPDVEHKGDQILMDIYITTDMVRDKLVKLKSNKASGPDEISINVFQEDLKRKLYG